MNPRRTPRPLSSLAIAISGLLVALPLLASRCEMACARSAMGSPSAPPSADHCAAHGDASPRSPAGTPAPRGCGHSADATYVNLKQTAAGALGSRVAPEPAVSSSAGLAFVRPPTRLMPASAGDRAAPSTLAGRPLVLRL